MRRQFRTGRASQIVVTVLMAATAVGCAQTKGWLSGIGRSSADEQISPGGPDSNDYLIELYQLTSGDPATQAEIYADANSAAMLTPGPSTNLRLALVLATPGHGAADPKRALSLLRELLAQNQLLTPAELSLATVHAKTVEELIVLRTQTERLRARSSLATQTETQATNQRLATVEAENRRLRRELEDAESKLDAITSIERSIREQD